MKKITEKKKSSRKIFEEFPDISIVDTITLQILLRYSMPLVRYALYVAVEQFLQNKKALSTSTFYNSLANLERKGYVRFIKKGPGIKVMVEATEGASAVIDNIFNYFIRNGLINESQFIEGLAGLIQEKIGPGLPGTVLLVMLDDFLNVSNVELSMKLSQDTFLLIGKDRQDDLIKLGFEQIKYSSVQNGLIREPDDFFDLIAFSGYCKNPDLYNLSRIDILKEAVRISKKGGAIILTARTELPETHNYYANELLEVYSKAVIERTFSKEELENDLANADIKSYEITEHKGMHVVICRV